MCAYKSKPGAAAGTKLELRLLGKFSVRLPNSEELRVPSLKGRLLCAMLASGPGDLHTRKQLSGLLWEDRPSEQALVSLRQELARLRSSLNSTRAEEWSSGSFLRLPSSFKVDVSGLLKAAEHGDAVEVARLYNGEFLEGEETRGPRLSRWLAKTRRDIALRVLSVCEAALAGGGLSAQEQEKIAELIVRLNPTAEAANISLIEAYATQHKTAEAIERYRIFTQALSTMGRKTPAVAEKAMAQVLERSRLSNGLPNPASRELDWLDEINRQHFDAAAPMPRPLVPPRDLPSVVVLPFRDVTPLSRALAGYEDGLTEEITTALARLRGLFVTARQSAHVYRREAKSIKQIAIELGVAYLIEGSIEIASELIRVNVRLIDGANGLAVWGEVFQAELGEFSEMRNRIVLAIVARLQPSLMQQEIERALRQPPGVLDAWTHYQRAQGHVLFTRNAERLETAVAELRSALRLDTKYAAAKSLLASVYTMRSLWGLHPRAAVEKKEAVRLFRSALRLDPEDSSVLINCADAALYSAGDLDKSLLLLNKAVQLNPADAHGLALFANVNRCADGDTDRSLEFLSRAMRLSPRDPRSHRWYHYSAWAYWKQGDFQEMERSARQAISLYSDAPAQWIALICSLGLQQRSHEAIRAAKILKTMVPAFTAQAFFEIARHFYKERFVREEEGYRRLCGVLDEALTGKL